MLSKTAPTAFNWKRIVGQRVRQLTADQAIAALEEIRKDGTTIYHPTVRALTNGLNSQSINTYVIRKLAVRAGILKEW